MSYYNKNYYNKCFIFLFLLIQYYFHNIINTKYNIQYFLQLTYFIILLLNAYMQINQHIKLLLKICLMILTYDKKEFKINHKLIKMKYYELFLEGSPIVFYFLDHCRYSHASILISIWCVDRLFVGPVLWDFYNFNSACFCSVVVIRSLYKMILILSKYNYSSSTIPFFAIPIVWLQVYILRKISIVFSLFAFIILYSIA